MFVQQVTDTDDIDLVCDSLCNTADDVDVVIGMSRAEATRLRAILLGEHNPDKSELWLAAQLELEA